MKQVQYLFLILVCLPLYADETENRVKVLALRGIDLATNLQYNEADEVFLEIVRLQPKNPRGYFFRSATYFWMFSEDVKKEEIGDKFRDLSYQAVEIAEARLEENEDDIDAMFFLGGAYGSLGRYYAMTKSFLNAYWYGKKGMGYLEDVIEADSTYYDAYLGLGIYHYLADVLPRFVKILSFILGISGDKELGLIELDLAARKGFYTRTEAMFFLGAIYTYRENEFEKAIVIFSDLLKRYPNNPGALLSLGRCYSNMGECDLAIEAFEKVLMNKEGQSRLPRGSIFYQLGDVYYKKNNFIKAADNYLLAIASDTAEVGKRRWIYPRSQYKLANCYEILGDTVTAKYYLSQISEEDNERTYERAQKRLNSSLSDFDILFINAENLKECNQFELSLAIFDEIEQKYKEVNDPDIIKKMVEVAYRKAEIYYEQKQYERAITRFKGIIALEEDKEEWIDHWSYFYLGNIYKSLGKYEEAEEAYDEAEDSDNDRLLEKIEDGRKGLPE